MKTALEQYPRLWQYLPLPKRKIPYIIILFFVKKEPVMKLAYIEVGQIVNTHGVRGELKVQPWCDYAEQFLDFETLYLDGQAVTPKSVRIHKNNVLLTLPGVDDMDSALHLKNKILSVRREDLALPEGRYLNAELMGLTVIDAESGAELGKIRDVLIYPANNVLVVKGEKEYLIPAVPSVIVDTNLDANAMTIHLMKGMATDEN